MGILSAIGGIVGLGNALTSIGDKIADAYKAKQEALTDRDRIAAEEQIKTLESQRDVLIAEQANASTRWVRPTLALIVVIYLFKVIVFDKVIGSLILPWLWAPAHALFRTDPLSEPLQWFVTVVIAAYFVTRPFEKWTARR